MTQVMPMRIRPSNQHPVFLNNPEPRRGLPCSRERALPAVRAEGRDEGVAFGGDAGAAGKDVEADTLTEEDFADWAADGGAVVGW